jgi:structural maintenance of chromosome 2
MKPAEILSMIEEAAGTRMFQTKKEQAMKTIEKKQLKVDELTKCMDDEINPSLEGLREQRQNYLDYQANGNELERLERFCVASEYCDFEQMVDPKSTVRKQIEEEKVAMGNQQAKMEAAAEECSAKIEEMEEQLQGDMKTEFTNLKKTEDELSKDLVKVQTLLKNHKETLQAEKDATASLQKQVEGAKSSLTEKEAELAQGSAVLAGKEAEVEAAEKEAKVTCERYQNAVAGVADESSTDVLSLPEQVAAWEKKAREAQSQLQTGAQRFEHAKKSLKELQKTAKNQQSAHGQGVKEMEELRKAINTLEGKLKATGMTCTEEEEAALRSKVIMIR